MESCICIACCICFQQFKCLCVFHSVTAYGWAQNIAPDEQSADPQDDIEAVEGDVISLSVYFTKNGPYFAFAVPFTIETSGTATGSYVHCSYDAHIS